MDWGTILYQFIALITLIAIPAVVIFFIRQSIKRNKQLQRIEDKLNSLKKENNT
ncbi:hypothetical protein BpOF4_16500 [Alkalihalophilus pseudofirmus OF4]|uniref:DUF4083 domain-containing protein n=1 Tax=Alkalihalophilus pseudofirmus (strain ATCC BAA-2126 / JCM 17055 / OF4) TaxID=398511 RepID=D3FQ52_ALKPO|nr:MULTISPECIES: hypothetical protein [Alkalihalophilus]ADC51345.1 hypothetical protein BpOF4_16500 [Alkalihalophilus pseudofirmus OF4]MED1601928.1 hypothetical protein [Alkalihalophilus marmarensis]WEG18777.1 hypothetical protein PQ478_09905 [Alkalihalophilus pseudofirmus]